MSVSRKENGSIVKKAGRALVDLALSLTSNNPVANSAVTNQLSANNNIFKAAYQNSKYGFIIDGTFYEMGGANTNMLNYSNGVEIASGGTYTASKTGEALIRFSSLLSSPNLNITINGKTVDHSAVIAKSHSGGADNTYFGVLNNKFVLDVGDTIVLPTGVTALFVPYK